MKNRFKLADDYLSTLTPITNLYNNIWFENSTALLHAPKSVDKSAMAVDIALNLTSRNLTVFYLSTNRLNPALHKKIEGNRHLYVHQSEFSTPDDQADFADIVFKDLEDAILETDARVFIIDSLTRIAALSFGRNASPTFLMKRLITLQTRHKISVLVIANDTSKSGTNALINLADSEITAPSPTDDKQTEPNTCQSVIVADQPIILNGEPEISALESPRNVIRRKLSRRDRRLLRRAEKHRP